MKREGPSKKASTRFGGPPFSTNKSPKARSNLPVRRPCKIVSEAHVSSATMQLERAILFTMSALCYSRLASQDWPEKVATLFGNVTKMATRHLLQPSGTKTNKTSSSRDPYIIHLNIAL